MSIKESLELDLLQSILDGEAVLFMGAGFSHDASNQFGRLPVGDELGRRLIEHGELELDPKEERLEDISQEFLRENEPSDLYNCLLDNLTVDDVSSQQELVAKMPWTSVFTTNYDDAFYKAKSNRIYSRKSFTDSYLPETGQNTPVIVHINGALYKASE